MKVSIIITSYNYENYIRDCIESCLNQKNFNSYEIIVVNDGSTDNTKEILNLYANKIKIINLKNSGIEKASNIGISNSLGKYIVRVDADDRLKENYLKEMIDLFENNDHFDFIYSNYFVINSKSLVEKEISLPNFKIEEIFERGDFLATGTIFNKKSILEEGLYSENVKNCGLENYELILKLLRNNKKGYLLTKPLFYYRIHDNNLSKIKKDYIVEFGKKLAKKYKINKYKTNENHPYNLKI